MNADLLGLISHEELSLPMTAEGQTVRNQDLVKDLPSTKNQANVKDNVGVTTQCTGNDLSNESEEERNNLKSTLKSKDTDQEGSLHADTKETSTQELQFVYDTKQESYGERVLLLPFDENNTSSTDDIEPTHIDSDKDDGKEKKLTLSTPFGSIHAGDDKDEERVPLLDSDLSLKFDETCQGNIGDQEIPSDQNRGKESAGLIENLPDGLEILSKDNANASLSPPKEGEILPEEIGDEIEVSDWVGDGVLLDSVDDTLIELTAVQPVDNAGHLLELSIEDSENTFGREVKPDMITAYLHKCSSQESMEKATSNVTLLDLARGDNPETIESDTEQTILIPSVKLKDVDAYQRGIEITDDYANIVTGPSDHGTEAVAPTERDIEAADSTERDIEAGESIDHVTEAFESSFVAAIASGVEMVFIEHSSDDETEPKSEDVDVDGDVITTEPSVVKESNIIEQDSDIEEGHLEVTAYQETEDNKVSVYEHPFVSHVNVESVTYPETCLAKEKKKKKKDSLKDSEDHIKSLLVSLNLKHLKSFLRTSLWAHDHQMRGLLWQQACKYLHKAGGDFYEEMVDELYNQRGHTGEITLPSFVDFDNLPSYHLNTSGIQSVHKILAVMHHTNPDITYCPTLFGLVSVFLHYMTPSEAYNCAYGLLRSKETFIMQTKVSYEATKMVIRDLTKKYAKSAYVNVVRNTNNIDGVFDSWYWWIFKDLPFPHLVCIIDCFILEGIKVFYRAALAILILYTKHTAKRTRSSSRHAHPDSATSIRQFCQDFPFRTDKLLRTGFGIRGLTRKHIKKLQIKNEMYINSRHLHTSASSQSMNGRRRANSGPTNFHVEGTSTVFTQDMPAGRSGSVGRLLFLTVNSAIVTPEELYTVWSWLPPRFAVCQPELLYTSEEHGTSLMTLYTRVEDHQPTLIVIKTTNDEVFGAFCSTYWRDRKHSTKNLSYFGTGETFIFTLNPKKQKYSWVGLQQEDIPNTANMFLAGDNSMLTVGGGNGEAIQLDANLLHCRTEKCDTFHNEPLCTGQDFTCKVVEVYGFV